MAGLHPDPSSARFVKTILYPRLAPLLMPNLVLDNFFMLRGMFFVIKNEVWHVSPMLVGGGHRGF